VVDRAASVPDVPYFICPNCAWRGARTSRTAGFTDRPAACERCGFGFLFELLDDYFPAPRAAIFVCDQSSRILAFGSGARELSGYDEQELMGSELAGALHLASDEAGPLPHETALEWGARVLDKQLRMANADGKVIEVTGDFFPAYDDDGGLLAILTPRGAS
jgi:PAS domain S-box-containing protein